MKLIKVDIINNEGLKALRQNAVQFIEREAQFMFVEYNENLDGAIYLVQEKVWQRASIELDTHNIDFEVISKHRIKD